ncbi:MAG: hypothetical protein JO363_16515 [Solirubrobacterales bacterium]|nr:hypothetical protein [Solirubrobacterales bacterium]
MYYEAALAHIEDLRRQAASAEVVARQPSLTQLERTARNVRRFWTVALRVKRGLDQRNHPDASAGEGHRDDALAA